MGPRLPVGEAFFLHLIFILPQSALPTKLPKLAPSRKIYYYLSHALKSSICSLCFHGPMY